jgi:uncharacterized glyoxalase superfamily protein PhnB
VTPEAATASGVRLMWDSVEMVRTLDPEWSPPAGGYRQALAFLCSSPTEVDATSRALREAGHRGREPYDAPWGQRYATVVDPDGNPVDLFAPLP